jgi:hypothetical protein
VHPRAHLQRRAETSGATGLSDGRPIRALGSLRLPKPETNRQGDLRFPIRRAGPNFVGLANFGVQQMSSIEPGTATFRAPGG